MLQISRTLKSANSLTGLPLEPKALIVGLNVSSFIAYAIVQKSLSCKNWYELFIGGFVAQQHLFSEKGVPDQSMDVDSNTPPTFYETFLSINVDPGDTPLKPPPLLELLVSEVRQVCDDPRTRDRNQIMTRDQEVQQQISTIFSSSNILHILS